MSVQINESKKASWALLLGKLGACIAVISFGGGLWAINGGFSVLGLEIVLSSFNDAGKLYWVSLSSLTFHVPVVVPGLPVNQPVIPWLGVFSASLLQVCVIYLKLTGEDVPIWLGTFALVLSLYDWATTFWGITAIPWIAQTGTITCGVLAFFLTFIFEAVASFMLKEVLHGTKLFRSTAFR